MRVAIIAALVALLGGCIPQSIIRDRAIEQNVTIEDVTDTILVANILRARDQAPLQFADIPLMHESFQVTGGVTPTFVFGPVHPGSVSNSIATTVSVQEAPTFDLSNLDTQDFITGIMSPIKPRVVKYWLDRGLNDRIALLLFFSGVTITVKDSRQPPLTILNDPRRALEPTESDRGFLAYLRLINGITGKFRIVEAPDLTPVGPPFALEMDKHLRELSKVDTDKYELDPLELNPDVAARAKRPYTLVKEPDEGIIYPRYQLFSVSEKKILICFDTARASARSAVDQKLCKQPAATPYPACAHAEDFLRFNNCSATLKFSLRSAGDVVHFLGDLVWLQENNVLPPNRLHNPITLEYCPPGGAPGCSEGGALFNITRETQQGHGRLRVPYRGEYYTVPNASPDDHTLQVLAITSQVVNLNKSAKELRSTPTVQIVP